MASNTQATINATPSDRDPGAAISFAWPGWSRGAGGQGGQEKPGWTGWAGGAGGQGSQEKPRILVSRVGRSWGAWCRRLRGAFLL